MTVFASSVFEGVSAVASSGTGTITLSGTGQAVGDGTTGRTFASAVGANAEVTIRIIEGSAWEECDSTYTHSGTTLSRGTLRASSTGSRVAFNTSGTGVKVGLISGQDNLRRFEAAALAHSTVSGTSGAITAEVNTLYVADMSGWTADRTLTLPATAAVGDRVGMMVSVGDDAYEWLVTATAGDTLNGVAGGTEWSRIFITGEVLIMRCVVANTTWVVEVDGRIKCSVLVTANGSTTQTGLTRNAVTQISTVYATVVSDVGGNWSTANKRLEPRRSGVWVVSAGCVVTTVQSGAAVVGILRRSGSNLVNGQLVFGNGSANMQAATSSPITLTNSQNLDFAVYYEDSGTNRATTSAAHENYFRAVWVGD